MKLQRTDAIAHIIGLIIAHEDRTGNSMTMEEIIEAVHYPGVSIEALLYDMLELSYLSCSISEGRKGIGGNAITDLRHSWGTTFFGREWFRHLQHQQHGHRNVNFIFGDR